MSQSPPSSDATNLRLVLGDWTALGVDAGTVRQAVFVHEQGIPLELEWDEWDARSEHCVAYDGAVPVGTGRLLPDGHIGRMAVLKSHRGARAGGLILERLIERGRQMGHRSFELSAQQYVSRFYRRHGFVQIGQPYDEVGIAHVRMRLDDALPAQSRVVEREWQTAASDGCALYQREWLPGDDSPAGSIYLLHGLGEHIGRYGALARWLCGMGWQVRGHDHRGHGRSQGRRGVLRRQDDLLDDAWSLLSEFDRQTGRKAVLIGHSMGGLLAAQLATRHQSALRALVLSSPGLDAGLSRLTRLQIRIMNALAPELAVPNGLAVDRLSHDSAVVSAYRNDPLTHNRVTGRLMDWFLRAGVEVMAGAPAMSIPALLLVAGDDHLVDSQASRRFVERAAPRLVTMKWYDGLYHELFNERAADRSRVLDDLRGWLAALPK